jgi:hypothetical protein
MSYHDGDAVGATNHTVNVGGANQGEANVSITSSIWEINRIAAN